MPVVSGDIASHHTSDPLIISSHCPHTLTRNEWTSYDACLFFLSLNADTYTQISRTTTTYESTECGIENIRTRIVNGTRVPNNRYPWIVYISLRLPDGTATSCTGSVINDRYILTAGHCVFTGGPEKQDASALRVYRGPSCLSKLRTEDPLLVRNIYKNPGYQDYADSADDIALLELFRPFSFDKSFSPICLPNFNHYENFLAAGYGRTNFGFVLIGSKCLKEAQLNWADTAICQKMGGAFDETKSLCVGGGRSAACNGDSGGALMTRKAGRVYAVGIASTAGADCGTITHFPNIYERVHRHTAWIREKTGNAKWCSGPLTALP